MRRIVPIALIGLALVVVLATSGTAAPPRTPVMLSATVALDGHLVSGNGAVSAVPLALGHYSIKFDRDVSGCQFVGGAADYPNDGYAGPDSGITIGVGPRDNDVTSLEAVQYDAVLGYENNSSPFDVIAECMS